MTVLRHYEVRCPKADKKNKLGYDCKTGSSNAKVIAHTIAKWEVDNDFDIICVCDAWFQFPSFREKVTLMDSPSSPIPATIYCR